MDQIGQWIVGLVGSGFCIYGISALLSHFSWQRKSHTITGFVYAIEKYESESTDSDGHRSRNVFYRALVKYHWGETERLVKGVGTSRLTNRIGQVVKVQVRVEPKSQRVQARLISLAYLLAPMLFFLVGLAALAGYCIGLGGFWWIPVIGVSAGVGLVQYIGARFSDDIEREEDQQDISPDSVVFDTPEALAEERRRYWRVARFIQGGGVILGLAFLYWAFNSMTSSTQELLQSGKWFELLLNDELNTNATESLILFAFGGLFTLSSVFSWFQSRNK